MKKPINRCWIVDQYRCSARYRYNFTTRHDVVPTYLENWSTGGLIRMGFVLGLVSLKGQSNELTVYGRIKMGLYESKAYHLTEYMYQTVEEIKPRLAKWHRNLTLESESRVSILCLGTKLVCHRWSRQRLSRQTANESLYVYLISIASRIWFSLMDCKCNRDWRPGLLV